MSVHAPLANRRQTMATASLRQDDEDVGLFIGLPSEEPTVTLVATPTTADEPTAPTTVTAKTLAQDPGFIFLGSGFPDFPAFTSWTHPAGASDKAWIQLFGPDATQWMLQLIDSGLAVLRNGAVAAPIMVVPTQEVVGGEALAPTQVITTTADLEPSAPSLAVDTGITGGTTILRGATITPITTGVTRTQVLEPPEMEDGVPGAIVAGGAGGLAVLAIGAFFLFGRRR